RLNAIAISDITPGEAMPWVDSAAGDVRVFADSDYSRLRVQALGQLSSPRIEQVYNSIESAGFSPTAPLLDVSRTEGKLYVHDWRRLPDAPLELIRSDLMTALKDDQGLSPGWADLAWSDDGKRIAGYRADGQVGVWAFSTGSRQVRAIPLGE